MPTVTVGGLAERAPGATSWLLFSGIASPAKLPVANQPAHTPLRIAIDVRAAAETPAGRGRYIRELISHLAPLLGDNQLLLYARKRWEGAPSSPQISWRLVAGSDLLWPLAAGRAMRGECDVALATGSYLLCALAPRPVHSMVWDMVPFHPELHPPRGSLFERVTLPLAARRCTSFVAISAATREELIERYPRVASRVAIAHPAAGEQFTPAGSERDAEALARHGVRPPYVLATGTLEPRKNLSRLISAFASLPAEIRAQRQLVLAGAPGWETAETFAHVASHSALVKTLGFVPDEDLPALYRQADLFCYPSLYEGFGIPVLEAMRCGTAVLTSGRSSMPEVAADAALYVDPLDSADIARALKELLSDPSTRERLGAKGIERARSFTWEATAKVVLGALEAR